MSAKVSGVLVGLVCGRALARLVLKVNKAKVNKMGLIIDGLGNVRMGLVIANVFELEQQVQCLSRA